MSQGLCNGWVLTLRLYTGSCRNATRTPFVATRDQNHLIVEWSLGKPQSRSCLTTENCHSCKYLSLMESLTPAWPCRLGPVISGSGKRLTGEDEDFHLQCQFASIEAPFTELGLFDECKNHERMCACHSMPSCAFLSHSLCPIPLSSNRTRDSPRSLATNTTKLQASTPTSACLAGQLLCHAPANHSL
jgi:hypothetical protein